MSLSNSTIINQVQVIFCFLMIFSIHVMANFVATPAFLQLGINSITCVYIGCILASKIQKNAGKLERKDDTVKETMTNKDAYMFPVYGSCALGGIYVLYKFLPKEYLNFIFTIHFTIIGVFCLAELIGFPLSKVTPDKWNQVIVLKIKKTIDFKIWQKEIDFELNYFEAFALAISLFPTIVYLMSKNWITNNIFGIAFSVVGIEQMVLPTFQTGFILLWGLFFYDIFWVYGTDVMVTVAKSFDVPIKLLFPYAWNPEKFSMLGLGDIVIPGIFVALCLKYDMDKNIDKIKSLNQIKTPLFNWCFGGYILGICVTYIVMIVTNHPQPALLFLVPAVTGAVALKGYLCNEFSEIWKYEEGTVDKTAVEKEKK